MHRSVITVDMPATTWGNLTSHNNKMHYYKSQKNRGERQGFFPPEHTGRESHGMGRKKRREGRELHCFNKEGAYLTHNLHLSRLIMEPTRSPTVMVACSSSWCLRLTNHQSTRNKASARILMPAQMPTYLQSKRVCIYLKRNFKFPNINLNYPSFCIFNLLLPTTNHAAWK